MNGNNVRVFYNDAGAVKMLNPLWDDYIAAQVFSFAESNGVKLQRYHSGVAAELFLHSRGYKITESGSLWNKRANPADINYDSEVPGDAIIDFS